MHWVRSMGSLCEQDPGPGAEEQSIKERGLPGHKRNEGEVKT